MKKLLSIILAFCLSVCLCVPAFAEDAPQTELFRLTGTDDGVDWLYLYLDKAICGVADDWQARFVIERELSDYAPEAPQIDAEKLYVRLPNAENEGRLELFIPLADEANDVCCCDLTVTGLLDASGAETERTFQMGIAHTDDQGEVRSIKPTYTTAVLTAEIPNPDYSLSVNYFNGNVDLNDGIFERREQEARATRYCFTGDTIRFAEELPQSLRAQAKLTCDGAEITQNDDGSFTAVSGEGTATLQITPLVRYTVPFCIGTEKEMRSIVLGIMLRHPLDVAKVWISGAELLGSFALFPFGGLFLPLLFGIGVLTAPLGNLLLMLWMVIWLR